MAQSTFAGHPLHPQLVTLPAALLPTSLTFDLANLATGKRVFSDAAGYTLAGGLAGGAAAALAGAADYLAIKSGTHSKRVANVHALLNLGVLAAGSLSLLMRPGRGSHGASVAVSALANALVLVSAWYGGHLVYSHGLRVSGVNPIAHAPELKLPGDGALADQLTQAEGLVPETGPELRSSVSPNV